jgi:hypothetical protein
VDDFHRSFLLLIRHQPDGWCVDQIADCGAAGLSSLRSFSEHYPAREADFVAGCKDFTKTLIDDLIQERTSVRRLLTDA